MNHYYSEKPSSKSDIKEIEFLFSDKTFNFYTDSGVFSKNKIDFGSELMLKTFLKHSSLKKGNFLDIGCGYGPVGIIAKTFLPDLDIYLSDVNERALELTEKNMKLNNISDYNIIKSYIFDNIHQNFDCILSNPPIRAGKDIIFKIYEESFQHLNNGGVFYCVIQTKHGAKSTFKKLESIFGNCETLAIDAGYRILFSKKI
jgi:16S rRNA (guanine1207-N2)-methyltransferase